MRPRVLYFVALLLVAILAAPACASMGLRNTLDWSRQRGPDQSVVDAYVRLGELAEAETYLRWFGLPEPEIMSRVVKAREKVRAEDARRIQEGGRE